MSNDVTDLVYAPNESLAGESAIRDLDLSALTTNAAVSSVVPINSTTVRVTFLSPVLDNAVLRYAAAYELAQVDGLGAVVVGGHAPLVLAVTPSSPAPSSYVDLTVEEMRASLPYRLLIDHLEGA